MAREPNQDAASSSKVWQKDAEMDKSTRRLVAAENDQELLNFRENQKNTRKLVASGNSDIDGIGTIWPPNLHIYTACVSHLEKVLSNVRHRYGLKPGDKNGKSRCKCDCVVNVYVRFSSRCSSILGKIVQRFCIASKISPKRTLKQLFNVTEKLIRNQTEISGMPVINWQQLMWQRTTLLTDKAVQFATAKKLRLFRFSMGGNQFKSRQSMEGEE